VKREGKSGPPFSFFYLFFRITERGRGKKKTTSWPGRGKKRSKRKKGIPFFPDLMWQAKEGKGEKGEGRVKGYVL